MDPLYKESIRRTIVGFVLSLALIFIPAGTWHYWQGWLFLTVFTAMTTGFTIYMALYNKPLLDRRLKAGPKYEKERSQKKIITAMFAVFFALIVLPILDYRFGLSPVPAWASIVGDSVVVFSFFAIFWVLSINSWAASNVGVEGAQPVVDTGPYAFVRHPMYAFALFLCAGIPLALGSWWSIGLVVFFFPVLMWRLLDEERILQRDLPGYTDYMQKVRYRLIPKVW